MKTRQTGNTRVAAGQSRPAGLPAAQPGIKVRRKARGSARSNSGTGISPEEFRRMIENAAYLRAERRGFAAGHELEDWLEAEAEVRSQIGPTAS